MSFHVLSERRKADRAEIAAEIARLAHECGLTASIDAELEHNRETWVSVLHPESGLSLTVTLDGQSPQPDIHVLSWHFAIGEYPDATIKDGFAESRNEHHRRKATDICRGTFNLLVVLERRFAAIEEGTAVAYAAPQTIDAP